MLAPLGRDRAEVLDVLLHRSDGIVPLLSSELGVVLPEQFPCEAEHRGLVRPRHPEDREDHPQRAPDRDVAREIAGVAGGGHAIAQLAGRIVYVEPPLVDAMEAPLDAAATERPWNNRGGFPESLLAESVEDIPAWRRAFVRSYLECEVPMFAPHMPAETIGRLWTRLARATIPQLRCR